MMRNYVFKYIIKLILIFQDDNTIILNST